MDPPGRVLCTLGGAGDGERTVDVLEDEGFDVVTVEGPGTALDRLETDEFDCVLVESSITGSLDRFLDGVRERSPDLHVVALVGPDGADDVDEVLSLTGADYVRRAEMESQPRALRSRVASAVTGTRTRRDLERYRGLVGTVGDPMYVLDTEGEITFTNDAMLEMLEADGEAVLGRHASEMMGEGDFERGTERIGDILGDADRDSVTVEVDVQPFEGDPIPAEINVAPLFDDSGSFRATVGVVRDISDRKRREERLGALHDTTRRLMDATDVDTVVEIGVEAAAEAVKLDLTGFYRPAADSERLDPVATTDAVYDLLGEPPSIERGEGLFWEAFETGEAIFADDVATEPEAYNPETPIGSEMVFPVGEHGVFAAASTETHGFDAIDKELAGVLVSNLTRAIDSVQREDRLRQRERELEQYETIIRASPDEVYTLDAEGYFTSIVPPTGSTLTTSGYEPTELVGEHVSTVMTDEDIATGRRLIQSLVEDDDRNRASFEMEVVTRSGERVPNENHVGLLPTDADEQFRGTVGVLRNIEERKKRERQLQRQNERLEQFAHIASHDLRNPLNVAAGRLTLAMEDCESEHLEHVNRSLERMETLIDDTLTMAKEGRTVSAAEPVDLSELAARCWDAIPDEGATIDVGEDVCVRGDPDRLKRVLENLFRNAVEHGGPEVSISFGPTEDGGFYVADDGPGIPAEERSAVFEVGHTTADGGTGFGLAIVQEVVQAHGWEIDIQESEAGGARFEITGVDAE